ncbi:hypothetical protein FB45DRAFT_755830, partial [Roridomyces roridus]
LSPDILRPLLACKDLGSFTLQLYPGFDADDDFLAEIATAWPNIHTLKLFDIHVDQEPTVTLACLIPFARHCPDLSTLGIRMFCSEVPTFSHTTGDRFDHYLDVLEVGTSPITEDLQDVSKIAAFLSNLFPHLSEISSSESDEENSARWDRVVEMVPVFASVRVQEKNFWTEELSAEQDSDDETGEESSTQRDAEEDA